MLTGPNKQGREEGTAASPISPDMKSTSNLGLMLRNIKSPATGPVVINDFVQLPSHAVWNPDQDADLNEEAALEAP